VSVRDLNFEDLLTRYFEDTTAPAGEEYLLGRIDAGDGEALVTMLRDHRKQPIEKAREIEMRNSVDALLNFYSVLELALATDFVSAPLHLRIFKDAPRILNHDAVRSFYRKCYPLRLPELFCRRLASADRWPGDTASDGARAIFATFLSLDTRFVSKLQGGVLLPLLDGFWFDEVSFDVVVDTIAKPKEYLERVLVDPEEDDTLSAALREFGILVRFCKDFRHLLRKAADHPALQSGLWSYYGYWFEIIGAELAENLRRALRALGEWAEQTDAKEAKDEISRFVSEALGVFDDLTSTKYAAQVDAMLRAPAGVRSNRVGDA
jgi:hypothetical protein